MRLICILAEQLVYTQLLHSSRAAVKQAKISTYRTRGGLEIDFILEIEGDLFAIEVKGAESVEDGDASAVRGSTPAYGRCRGRRR